MPNPLTCNAICMCSFGMAPMPLLATNAPTVLTCNQITATIMDLPKTPFGMCSSMANPAVASATAAALGVLTPMPCTPVILPPWMPGKPTVLVANKPIGTNSDKTMCAYGGLIQITMTPAVTVNL